jgi:hypothetical protein
MPLTNVEQRGDVTTPMAGTSGRDVDNADGATDGTTGSYRPLRAGRPSCFPLAPGLAGLSATGTQRANVDHD